MKAAKELAETATRAKTLDGKLQTCSDRAERLDDVMAEVGKREAELFRRLWNGLEDTAGVTLFSISRVTPPMR